MSERLPGETRGVVDMERGGSSRGAVGVQPAHGNPDLGAWGWAGVGRCNCYISEPVHAQQPGSRHMSRTELETQRTELETQVGLIRQCSNLEVGTQ